MVLSALSVVAPWGVRIARGIKTVEVRRWRPAALPMGNLLIVENDRYLRGEGEIDPAGRAVALVAIREVHDWRPEEVEAACANSYEAGWLAWRIEEVRPIEVPFGITAARGIYEVHVEPGLLGEAILRPKSGA